MKIVIDNDILGRSVDVYVFQERGDVVIPYKVTIKEMPPVTPDKSMDASCSMKREVFGRFVTAIKEALALNGFMKEIGPLEGELKATKVHLEDLRSFFRKKNGLA